MHRKLLIAVLALGVFLILPALSQANFQAPDQSASIKGSSPHGWAKAQAPSNLTKTRLPNAPAVQIQAGQVPTAPGTYCTGDWMDVPYFIWNLPVGPGDMLWMFQDPANTYPNAFTACSGPAYTFNVVQVRLDAYHNSAVANTYTVRPVIYSADMTDPSCPIPGTPLVTGPAYNVTLSAQGLYALALPFSIEACVTGPYFAAVQILGNVGLAGKLLVVTDQGQDLAFADPPNALPGIESRSFILAAAVGGFGDFVDPPSEPIPSAELCFNASGLGIYNNEMWSEGYTPSDPLTACTPGTCDWNWWYVGTAPFCGTGTPGDRNNDCWDAFYGLPSAAQGGRYKMGTGFEAIGADTLKAVEFTLNSMAGLPDIRVEIWAQGGSVPCGPTPSNALAGLLYSVVIPNASLFFDGATPNYVPIPDIVWGTLNGGPTQTIFVTVAEASNGVNGATGLTAYGPDYVGPACPGTPAHSVAFFPAAAFNGGLPTWTYLSQVPTAFTQREFSINAYVCREVLPAIEADCGPGGPDSWRHFAHDAQLTSASHVNVGDPNGAILRWTQGLPEASNFTNPSVAGDIVYYSSDKQLSAFNLITGAPVGTLNGLPEMGSSNRGNTTIANIPALARDVVYATSGNFNGITALETNLESSPKIWSFNPGTHPPGGLGKIGPSYLDGQVRFNSATVLTISGTSVLFVETEPASGPGELWALNAATGGLYPGWAINPLQLDQAARNGPATDGTNLYFGTGLISNTGPGSVYSVVAATGVVNWQYTDPSGEGFGCGVSVEGNFLYTASSGAAAGHRYKLDKSGASPVVKWSVVEPLSLYATPTIGRAFVYYPIDGGSGGILQVNKDLGIVARNFGTLDICGASVGNVPCIATLSCDDYLFAGDRNSRWWLFNTETGTAEWYRDFNLAGAGIVQGTALATASTGARYAVLGLRASPVTGFGQVSAYQLDAGPRPRMIQCLYDTTIAVPFGTLGGNPAVTLGVFKNIGNTPLNFSATAVIDPLPDGLAAAATRFRHTLNLRQRLMPATDESFATDMTLTKRQRMAGITTDRVDGEWSANDYQTIMDMTAMASSKTRTSSRHAAGAATVRTSNVQLNGSAAPYALAPGSSADLTWDYDGTALGRGQDLNVIEVTTDDPDFNFDAVNNSGISYADYSILYAGGCLFAADTVHFNSDGSYETVYNHGSLGDDATASREFNFAGENDNFFDGSLIIAGDSVAGLPIPDGGAQWFGDVYGLFLQRFLPDVSPISGQCGVDKLTNVLVGQKRTGGCPGTPADIFGDKAYVEFVDSNLLATSGTPGAAIGLVINQTEVTSYDPLYGDFKLVHYKVTNRDAVAKGPLYPAAFTDWDVSTNGAADNSLVSDAFNGYAQWQNVGPTYAYGMLNPNQPTTYAGVDPSADSPYRIAAFVNSLRVYDPAPWTQDNDNKLQATWSQLVHETPFRIVDAGQPTDCSDLLVLKPFSLAPNGIAEFSIAVFGVDASTGVPATIEANGAALAKRAARWGGYARGDVNDDGFVDLGDVVWLQCGNPIYPAAYSGDVNNDGLNNGADIAQLLSFVSGNAGSRPVGAWRF